MRKNKTAIGEQTAPVLVPFNVKVRADLHDKLKTAAAEFGCSVNDIAAMSLAFGLPGVKTSLHKIHNPEEELKPAA